MAQAFSLWASTDGGKTGAAGARDITGPAADALATIGDARAWRQEQELKDLKARRDSGNRER
jgi:hypothetical protein